MVCGRTDMSVFAPDHTICPQKEVFQASNYALQHPHFYHSHKVAYGELLLQHRDYCLQIYPVRWGLFSWWVVAVWRGWHLGFPYLPRQRQVQKGQRSFWLRTVVTGPTTVDIPRVSCKQLVQKCPSHLSQHCPLCWSEASQRELKAFLGQCCLGSRNPLEYHPCDLKPCSE